MNGPLCGLRVVDWSNGFASRRATGLLADYGADVIRVEPAGNAMQVRPTVDRAVERSYHERGKRSVFPTDRALDLLSTADLLIEDWTDNAPPVDHGALMAANPALVRCTITSFGEGSPLAHLPAYESLVHAYAGTMYEQIGHREGPIYEALPFASIGASYLALIGSLAALLRRAEDGIGRRVETSLFDGAHAYLSMLYSMRWDESGAPSPHHELDLHNPVPSSLRLVTGAYLCADGEYIGVHTGAVGAFGRLMRVTGLDDRVPPSDDGMDMMRTLGDEERTALEDLHDIFAKEPRDVWVERLVAADVCGIPVLHPGEAFDQAQVRTNGMVIKVADPVLGSIEQVGPSVTFADTPAEVDRGAPLAGEHTGPITALLDAGTSPWQMERRWLGDAPRDDRPLLDGIRVIDLGAYYAGPYSSRLLADLGADVIKVEPTRGDQFRGTLMFRSAQAGKRSVALDLTDERSRPVMDALVATADILCHNMRPGAAEKLGIDYNRARSLNPAIIYGHAVGWGVDGPNARWQSFEPMMSGFCGVEFEVAGRYNSPLYPAGNADPGNGLAGAVGMLMALLHRQRAGAGQHFINAQLNATMTHLGHIVRAADGTVLGAERLDPMQYGFDALDRLYECGDGWIVLAVHHAEEWAALRRFVGVDDDERFATAEARAANDYELAQTIEAKLRESSMRSALAALADAGVPAAAPIAYDNRTFMHDRYNVDIGRVTASIDGESTRREIGLLLRVIGADEAPRRAVPGLGEHSAEVLTELGFDNSDLLPR